MLSPENLEKIKELLNQIWADHSPPVKERSGSKSGKKNINEKKRQNGDTSNNVAKCFDLTTSELLVITGLIIDVLNVESVLVSRDQVVQIVLSGNLKRKTELERVMEQVGKLPFDQVIKAIIENNL